MENGDGVVSGTGFELKKGNPKKNDDQSNDRC